MNNRMMKLCLASCLALGLFSSCSKDEPDPSRQVFKTDRPAPSVFDVWLKQNYVDAYNLDFQYKLKDNELDRNYNHTPATLENSMKMSKIVRHAWIEAYDEVTGGVHFMRRFVPRQIFLVGSAAWNVGDGSRVLGTAEGGLKVTLYEVNALAVDKPEQLNDLFFHTMHHEFSHILHQTKTWPVEFNEVSKGDYLPANFFGPDYIPMNVWAPLGFVSAYARSQDLEDIAEVTAYYITRSDKDWATVFEAAGEAGTAKIKKKQEIMKGYMLDTWNIDMDKLRAVCARRSGEVTAPGFKLINDEWLPLLPGKRSVSVLDEVRAATPRVLTIDEEAIRTKVIDFLLANRDQLDMTKRPGVGGARCQVFCALERHLH